MATTESIPFKYPGDSLTFKASALVNGRRFVKITGNRTGGGAGGLSTDPDNVYQAAQCVAGDAAVAVSAYDAASAAKFKGWTGPGMIVPVDLGGNVTAGDVVQSDAAGKAVTISTGRPLGIAMTGGTSGAIGEIRLFAVSSIA